MLWVWLGTDVEWFLGPRSNAYTQVGPGDRPAPRCAGGPGGRAPRVWLKLFRQPDADLTESVPDRSSRLTAMEAGVELIGVFIHVLFLPEGRFFATTFTLPWRFVSVRVRGR